MKYYKIYHQCRKHFYFTCALALVGVGLGSVIYLLTDSPVACLVSIFSMMALGFVLWFKWIWTLPCPHCGCKAMYLQTEGTLHPIIHGYRKYIVQCRKCNARMYTDMALKEAYYGSWHVKLTEEEIEKDLSGI